MEKTLTLKSKSQDRVLKANAPVTLELFAYFLKDDNTVSVIPMTYERHMTMENVYCLREWKSKEEIPNFMRHSINQIGKLDLERGLNNIVTYSSDLSTSHFLATTYMISDSDKNTEDFLIKMFNFKEKHIDEQIESLMDQKSRLDSIKEVILSVNSLDGMEK